MSDIIPFSKLNSDVFLPILNKVSPRTFCRLRRSCKAIDEFAENNRNRICCRVDEWNLLFQIPEKRKPSLEIHVLKNRRQLSRWYQFDKLDYFESHIKITEPFRQLSGLVFSRIAFDRVDSQKDPPRHSPLRDVRMTYATFLRRQTAVWEKTLVPLVTQLKPRCHNLEVHNPVKANEFLPLIRFSEILIDKEVTLGEYEALPIGHCSNVKVRDFLEVPDRISPIVRNFKNCRLIYFANIDNWFSKIKAFLTESLKDRSTRGNLEILCFETLEDKHFHEERRENRAILEVLEIPGMVKLWTGWNFDARYPSNNTEISRLSFKSLMIDGGWAIIVEISERVDTDITRMFYLHFITEFTRASVFEILSSYIFTHMAIDASRIYDKFMETEDEPTAFLELQNTCLDLYR